MKDHEHNAERYAAIKFLSELAEDMVFPVSREQAISLVTLVFHFMWREWQDAGKGTDSYHSFEQGAKRLFNMIRTHDMPYTKDGLRGDKYIEYKEKREEMLRNKRARNQELKS